MNELPGVDARTCLFIYPRPTPLSTVPHSPVPACFLSAYPPILRTLHSIMAAILLHNIVHCTIKYPTRGASAGLPSYLGIGNGRPSGFAGKKRDRPKLLSI